MEKISAARAMEWSIELEKGLRSKKPGQSIESIKSIGPRLHKWSMEPSITMEISDMYGLVPGEDRAFANTILLRLAHAFKSGDNYTRSCIVKVFHLEVRHLRKMGKRYNGILAKERVPNYVEVLKRVKTVFDTGDFESKALTLHLFGCLAGLAKDSAQIRHIILLSLQSSHVCEVKASLFAAGCFCLLSDDFACIILEILTDMVSSSQVPSEVTFAAIRVFSKMRCSSTIVTRAYRAGKKLMLGSLQTEFKSEMLSSLSLLAFRSILLYTEQVDLLLSCLNGGHASILKAKALRCLYFMLSRGSCQFPVNTSVLNKLFHIVDDNDLPLECQCQALRILCKIFCSLRADPTYIGIPDLLKLARSVEKVAQTSAEEKKCLAFRFLAGILCSLKNATGQQCSRLSDKSYIPNLQSNGQPSVFLASNGDGPGLLVMNLTSYIIDHIQCLMKQKFTGCGNNMVDLEDLTSKDMHSSLKNWKRLLDLVLCLAERYPSSGLIALERIECFIETLVSLQETFNKQTSGLHQMEMVAEKPISVLSHPKHNNIISELISWICRFINVLLITLFDETEICSDVYEKGKLLVEKIEVSGSWDCCAYEIFCLCMRSSIKWTYPGIMDNTKQTISHSQDNAILGLLTDVCWVCQERQALEFTKQMVRRRNNWTAYRAGKYSCCKGLWFAATFTFRKLIDVILSDICRSWLKSLMLLSGGESEIKLLLFPKVGKELVDGLQIESDSSQIFCNVSGEKRHSVDIDANLSNPEGKFERIYSRISSSEEILSAVGASDGVFYFQRWFLSLRAKVLETLIDLLGLLSTHTCSQKVFKEISNGSTHSTAAAKYLGSMFSGFVSISLKWSRIAKEYDLLATTFPDIDSESFRNISSLALNCSLLSFCITFSLYLPKSSAYDNVMSCCFNNLGRFSPNLVLRDLVERLSDMDEEITNLMQQFMTVSAEVTDSFQSRTHIHSVAYMEKGSLSLIKFAIAGVLHSQKEAEGVRDDRLSPFVSQGLQLISDIIIRWLGVSFKIPKFFFRVRPCIGAELFIFSGDSTNKQEISCSAGSQLSLNLCVQIKNASVKPSVQISKVYCIIAAKAAVRTSSGREDEVQQMAWSFNARNMDGMVELAELLMAYMRTETKGCSSGELVTACVCFEVNATGQGFSSCVLNVSGFPTGSYRIKWHCCCFHENGSLWNLMPLNSGCTFTVNKS